MTRTATDTGAIDVGPKPRADQVRTAGAACALGGFALFAGAVTTQIIQASTSVSDQLWRYPWSSRTAVIAWAGSSARWRRSSSPACWPGSAAGSPDRAVRRGSGSRSPQSARRSSS